MSNFFCGVWNEFVNFIGGKGGLVHWILYCFALLYCLFRTKRTRKIMAFPSVLILIFFFNPFFYKYIGIRFLQGIYWRLMWMVPIIFVIAYALTDSVYRIENKFLRPILILLACICIICTGKRIFSTETYKEKENDYKISQAAIEISDLIQSNLNDWKETIIVPNELLCDVRQYSCSVGLLYGRNAAGFISEIGENETRVYEEMSKENPDINLITNIGRINNCRYIVFNKEYHRIPEDLRSYGYEKITIIRGKYIVYRLIPEDTLERING